MLPLKLSVKRFIPLFIILIAIASAFYFDLWQYLSWNNLQQQHAELKAWTDANYFYAVSAYIFIYIITVSLSIPGATILTLSGGFLFGIVWGAVYTVIAATIGASIIFLAVKTAFGDWLAKKAGPWLQQLTTGFQANAFSYLLFLRLVPLFPFWVVNIVPALLNMRLRSYVIATGVGIIPGSTVYVAVGNGLQSVFAQGGTPEFGIIFQPQILLPLIALGVLALVPVVYKRLKK